MTCCASRLYYRWAISEEWAPQGHSGSDGNLGCEGFHLLLPILFLRPLETGDIYLALGPLAEKTTLPLTPTTRR